MPNVIHSPGKGKSIVFMFKGIIRHYTDKQIRNKNLSSVNLSTCQGGLLFHHHLSAILDKQAFYIIVYALTVKVVGRR